MSGPSDRFTRGPSGPRLFVDGEEVGLDAVDALAWLAGAALVEVTAWRRPVYPQDAVDARLCGTCVVEFALSENAEVTGVTVSAGPDPLRSATDVAARDWRFAFKAGQEPRPVIVRVPFTFVEDQGHTTRV